MIDKIKSDIPISIYYNNTSPNYPLYNNNYNYNKNKKSNYSYNKICDNQKNIRAIGCLSLFRRKDYNRNNTISVKRNF